MSRFDRYPIPSVFNVLSAETFIGSTANITNVFLTAVQSLSVLNDPIIGIGVVGTNYVHTGTLTAENISATNIIQTQSGNSNFWNSTYTTVQNNSATTWNYQGTDLKDLSANWQSTYETVHALSGDWEESAEILPTVTDYLSTELVIVSSLNITQQLLSGNTDLLNIFLTPENTQTTSICAMSGDGVTPFVMQFTNGLLTSFTV
jgi:hypothetical protein